MLTQDSDTFLSQVSSWRTKRERGDTYRMPSGTWAEQAVTGASMSLRSDNGDLLGLIEKAWSTAKDTNITVSR